jgi:hypothetical protein
VQRWCADKQQELSLFRNHVIEASATELHGWKFIPVSWHSFGILFSDGEERHGFI